MIRDEVGIGDALTSVVNRGSEISDSLRITGHVLIELFDKDGVIRDLRSVHNLVVTAGKNHIAAELSAAGTTDMGWMEVGTGAVAAALGDTALGAAIATTGRQTLTSRTSATNVVTYVGDWAAGAATNAAITEAGIFNASAAGTMLARAVFTAINKGASDTLKITWTVTVG